MIFITFALGFFLLLGIESKNIVGKNKSIRYYFAFSQEPRKLYLE